MFSDAEDEVKLELLHRGASSGATDSAWLLTGCTSALPSGMESESLSPFCSIGKKSWSWASFFPRYRSVCLCHWWDLSKICACFFPRSSESLSSPLIALTSGSPKGLWWKGLEGKQKLKRALSSWWCPQVLGGSAGRRAAVALVPLGLHCGHGLGAAVLSTGSLTSMVCVLGEGIAFWPTVGVKDWGLI